MNSDPPAAPSTADLALTPPAPVTPLGPAGALEMVRLDQQTMSLIDQTVSSYVDSLMAMDPHSPAFVGKASSIHALGAREIRESASVSSRMLDRPLRSMASGPNAIGSTISTSLLQLRRTVEDLDPSRHGLGRRPRWGLGLFGNPARDYLSRYQSSQSHINAIVMALYGGQDELRKDNAAIEIEKANLGTTIDRLQKHVYMARRLDTQLEARILTIAATDPDRGHSLREDLLFSVRQKLEDLLTQLAVSIQGHLALDLIRRNNLELIKGVDRATTTTVSALRTAIIVAQALGNQKLVLDQVDVLNRTIGDVIDSSSSLLRQQSATIHEQGAGASVGVERLRAAFANIYATMDQIDKFKIQALQNMSQTADALASEVTRAQGQLDRARVSSAGEEVPGATGELTLPESR